MSRHRETRSRTRIHVALDESTLRYLTTFCSRKTGQRVCAGEVMEALVAVVSARPELRLNEEWVSLAPLIDADGSGAPVTARSEAAGAARSGRSSASLPHGRQIMLSSKQERG